MVKAVAVVVYALILTFSFPGAVVAKTDVQTGATIISSNKHDVSPRLRDIAPKTDQSVPKKEKEKKEKGFPQIAGAPDPVVQSAVGVAAPSGGGQFEGIGQGLAGYTVRFAPPDTNGAVGPNDFVETVNVDFAIFDRAGGLKFGPANINTLFTGFGGLCEADNDGDPTVLYDQLADRWVFQQFAVSGANGSSVPYLECIAVSTTGDPHGTYNRYSFPRTLFPDYPKLGLWPDAYYMSTNDFNGNTFAGASTWAFDRAAMLAGTTATAHVFHLSSLFGGLLPSSVDGTTLPPAGSPNYFVSLGTSTSLNLWKFSANFAGTSTLTGPTSIPVAGFTELCNGGNCVPQSGTTQKLDSLADRLMYRLAYRNFGDHEALVVTHSVAPATGGGGIRWYEIRSPGGTPTVFQQSTYAPDTKYRWMGSAAMDHVGNIGIGYTLSSSTTKPAIAYTGRLVSDPANTLQAEAILIQGTGSQLPTLGRWGDYSSMFVDPLDDCTFWYTSEYLTANGTFNWHTRIGTFKFASCSSAPPPTVTSVAPSEGPSAGGTTVTISGTDFQPGATAKIGGVSLTGVTSTSTSLSGTTGVHAAGSASVAMTNPDGQSATCACTYTYQPAPAPAPTSVTPSSGSSAGGTSVTIAGSNFQSGATAKVGGVALTAVTVTSTSLTGTTGSHAPSATAVDVVVTNPDAQSGTCVGCYTYTAANPPAITGVSPTSGPTVGGTTVTITGTDFQTGATASVGGVALTGVTVTGTQIRGNTGAHAAGAVDVLVTNPDTQTGTCSGCYTYVAGSNDNFANAFTISTPTSIIGNNRGATREAGEPRPCGKISATVWYKLTASKSGTLIASTIGGTNYDSVVAIYRGSAFSNLTTLGCNDDSAGTLQSQVSVSVTAGTTYYVQLGGFLGATGDFTLRVTLP